MTKMLKYRSPVVRKLVLCACMVLPMVVQADDDIQDKRTSIMLEAGERGHVLSEMHTFLLSVQQIIAAISADDMQQVEQAARASGRKAAHAVPVGLRSKLPERFKQLGHDTHRRFDELALDAEQLGDSEHSLSQLSRLMKNCVSCHEAYRL